MIEIKPASPISTNFDLSTKPVANPAVIFREGADNWAVLVNMDTAASIALNPTGILILKLIDGKRSVESIVKGLRDQFKSVPDSLTDDVVSLLKFFFRRWICWTGGPILTAPKSYVANPVVSCGDEGNDGAVLFNPDTDDSAIINATGKAIWISLGSPKTLQEIISILEERYQIKSPIDQTAKEVEDFLTTLTPEFVQEVSQ